MDKRATQKATSRKATSRKAERWKAVAQEDDVVTFEVRLEDDESEPTTEKLTLTEIADMLTKGGIPTSVEQLRRMKLVSTLSPMRFRKTITGKDKFAIQLVQ